MHRAYMNIYIYIYYVVIIYGEVNKSEIFRGGPM